MFVEQINRNLNNRAYPPLEARIAALSCWRLSDYVVSGMHDELWTLGHARLLLAEYLRHHDEGVKWLPVSELLLAQLFYSDYWGAGRCIGVGGGRRSEDDMWAEKNSYLLKTSNGIGVGKIVFLIFRICVNNRIDNMFRGSYLGF